MRIGLFWRVMPVYILVVAFFAVPLWQRHAAAFEAQQAAQTAQYEITLQNIRDHSIIITGEPIRIVLPEVGIDVPIVNGTYDDSKKIWSVADTTANYATNTALPNNKKDSTLIYGHWTTKIFGPTKNLKAGDKAFVYTNTGHILEYRYEDKTIIKPTDVDIFNNMKGRPGLALMTCQGTWAQERRLMFFNLEAAK